MNQLILRTPEGEVEIGVGKKVKVRERGGIWRIDFLKLGFTGVRVELTSNGVFYVTENLEDLLPPPQPKTVPLTDSDVLAMCRNGGVEFKTIKDNWVGCGDYFVQKDGSILLRSTKLVELTHYRLASENWEIEHEMTKTV